MRDNELLRMLIKSSSDAGFYRGLIESLLAQMTSRDEFYYELDAEVFRLVEKAMEDHK